MSRNGVDLRIDLPVKAGRFRRLVDFVWLCVWIAVEGSLIAELAGVRILPRPPSSLALPTVLFTAAGLFLLYRCLWYWTGRERFVAGPLGLVVRRQILGLGRTWTFPKDQIFDIRAERMRYRMVYPSWGRMFIGNGDGRIVVEAEGRSHLFGKGLEMEEAERLAELLRAELAESRRRQPTEFRLR